MMVCRLNLVSSNLSHRPLVVALIVGTTILSLKHKDLYENHLKHPLSV